MLICLECKCYLKLEGINYSCGRPYRISVPNGRVLHPMIGYIEYLCVESTWSWPEEDSGATNINLFLRTSDNDHVGKYYL